MKKSDVSIKIYNAKPLSFKVNNESDFEDEIKLEKISLSLTTEFKLDEKHSAVAIKLDINVLLKENKENLFSLVSFFEFGVFDLKDVLIEKNERKILEPIFARKLLNISIGGSRGMFSVYLSSTKYSDFVLPIANIPDDFFEEE